MGTYAENLSRALKHLQGANQVMVLSGAGMSTAAGIPDFRSPGGLYGSSEALLERFTYLDTASCTGCGSQRRELERDVKTALTFQYFSRNPLPYHEMRRGLIIGLGENQWKPTIGHVFPEILNRNNKLRMLSSQNIDGLDHKVVSDKRKLYNPHGLMSWLVTELSPEPLCKGTDSKIYQRYVELVKANIKDIYADRPTRQGRSCHLWPAPADSTPITLGMFGDLLPQSFDKARSTEQARGIYSVKPGSVMFDRMLWSTNAAGEDYNAFADVDECDMMLVMGTSLSGLTIDRMAYMAGQQGKPLLLFDMTEAPVNSCRENGAWKPGRDSLLQGPIDKSILDILDGLGWLQQIFDFLPHLCLGSLKTLRGFVADKGTCPAEMARLDGAIEAEVRREGAFYRD